jgi:2-keto-4-pentenoate hydratase
MGDLVARLVAAFQTAVEVEANPAEIPDTLDKAEEMQDRIIATLGPIVAYKLGATMPHVRAQLALSRPFYGAVPAGRMFSDGAEIPLAISRQTGVESEYAFRFGVDVAPDGPRLGKADLREIIDAVHPAIEVPATRFSRLAEFGGAGLVADNGAVGAIILGPARKVAGDLDALTTGRVTLEADGRPLADGSAGQIDDGAAGPLLTFIGRALSRGHVIRAGQVVVTGSCTGYVTVPRGTKVVARFDALESSVSMRFAPAP